MLDLVLFFALAAGSAAMAAVLADRRAPRLSARRGLPLALVAGGALGAATYGLSADPLLSACVAVAALIVAGVPQALVGGRSSH